MIEDRHTQLEKALRPVVEAMQFEFWGMELVQSRGHSTLRVYIELELRHITVDDCAAVSRRVSDVLDEIDVISEDYHLEVSSPGLDCPLFYASQYQRMLGCELQLSTHLPIDGRKRYRAFLIAASSDQIEISFEKKTLNLRYADIAKAHVIPDYSKPAPVRPQDPRPGSDDDSAD